MRYLLFGVLLFVGTNLFGQVPDSIEIYDRNAKSISYIITLYDQAVPDTTRKVTVVPTEQIRVVIKEENIRIHNGQVWYILTRKDKKLFEEANTGQVQ